VYVKITWVQEFLIRNREVMAVTLDEIDAVSRLCGTFGDSVWMRGLTLPWRILIVPTRKSLKRGRTTLRIKRQCTEPGIRRAGALHLGVAHDTLRTKRIAGRICGDDASALGCEE